MKSYRLIKNWSKVNNVKVITYTNLGVKIATLKFRKTTKQKSKKVAFKQIKKVQTPTSVTNQRPKNVVTKTTKPRANNRQLGINAPTYKKYQKEYQKARTKATETFYEQAAKARIISGDSSRVYKPYVFKYMSFKELMEKGVDVYKNGKKVKTLKGLNAVKHRINQLNNYISVNSKIDHWIKNYVKGLQNIGMPENLINIIKNKLKEINPDYLSYLITIGNIPDFSFIYDGDDAVQKFQEIMDRIWYFTEDKSNRRRFKEVQRQSNNQSYLRQEAKNIKMLDKASRGKKWKPL